MTQQSEDASKIRELAERLLAVRHPFGPMESGSPVLHVRRLPDGLPLQLPLPDGARIIGNMSQPHAENLGDSPRREAIDIVLDVPASTEELLLFYDRHAAEIGWSAPAIGMPPRFGGFTPSFTPPTRTYCQSPNGPWFSVRAVPTSGGVSEVRIHVNTASPGPCARPSPDMLSRGLLPTLEPPSGVFLQPLGGGGGPNVWSSTALATTEQTAVELEAHFARRFEAGGWILNERGSGGPAAWSTWTLASDEHAHGLLLIVDEPTPKQRLLHARAERSGPDQGAWSGWGGTPGTWIGSWGAVRP